MMITMPWMRRKLLAAIMQERQSTQQMLPEMVLLMATTTTMVTATTMTMAIFSPSSYCSKFLGEVLGGVPGDRLVLDEGFGGRSSITIARRMILGLRLRLSLLRADQSDVYIYVCKPSFPPFWYMRNHGKN
jgi:hypothetical protein